MDPYFQTRETAVIAVRFDSPDFLQDYYGYKNLGYPVSVLYSRYDEAVLSSWNIARC